LPLFNKNIKLNLLFKFDDLGFTPEQELAVSKFQKAFVDYQSKEALVNIFVFLMTAATLLLPIFLAFITSNISNLLLMLIYPISTIFMGQIRYSRMNIFLINFIGNIGVIYFIKLLGGPGWYWFVFLGLNSSNYMLLTKLPILRKKVNALAEDPNFLAVRDQIN
tara:strand:- start:356 stop:847 length:492 start_codon:yes stop_codon:yes gene_type:complete